MRFLLPLFLKVRGWSFIHAESDYPDTWWSLNGASTALLKETRRCFTSDPSSFFSILFSCSSASSQRFLLLHRWSLAQNKWRLTNTKPIHGRTSIWCVLHSRESAWKRWKDKVFFKFHIILKIEKGLPPIVLRWALEMDTHEKYFASLTFVLYQN